jgi:hypothetical protein
MSIRGKDKHNLVMISEVTATENSGQTFLVLGPLVLKKSTK